MFLMDEPIKEEKKQKNQLKKRQFTAERSQTCDTNLKKKRTGKPGKIKKGKMEESEKIRHDLSDFPHLRELKLERKEDERIGKKRQQFTNFLQLKLIPCRGQTNLYDKACKSNE